MKYGLVGASGKLGKEVINVFAEHNNELVFSFDIQGDWKQSDPEILIDCSLPEAFDKMMTFANGFNVPLIVATTGLTNEQINQLKKYSDIKPVVQSYNFSIGIQILLELTKLQMRNYRIGMLKFRKLITGLRKINHPEPQK